MEPIILPRISDQKPLVSIISITYNHEPYIRDCLESFLMQKTVFPLEIIIHDDASTDHTADIIREYYNKRPDLFHVIIQRENQYSQHKHILTELYKMAKGKYIALCEGEDFWIDPLKLQKQYNKIKQMEDKNCVGCVSFHIEKRKDKEELVGWTYKKDFLKKNKYVRHYFHTSSYLFDSEALRNGMKEYSTLCLMSECDTVLFYTLLSQGTMAIIKEPLTCWRITGEGISTKLSKEEHLYTLYLRQFTKLYLYGPRQLRIIFGLKCIKGYIKVIMSKKIDRDKKENCKKQLINLLINKKEYVL